MSCPSPHEVLIVGAGPDGLILAIDWRARGVAVRVIDARPTPSPLRATERQLRAP
ncbi:MAG: FAD-dependent monooxygenase [Deltaproteobacteria bacterium]|nr:FAD-dependent monooxygenase [Deltaproteobacteria bacterium]